MSNSMHLGFFLYMAASAIIISSCKKSVDTDIPQPESQIIADHSVVDMYDKIPQQYIDSVKKMFVSVAGESHSAAYRYGLLSLETINPVYAVSVRESGIPESYTASNLRFSRATWGDISHDAGWIYSYGEEDWFTSDLAINRTKAGITYCMTNNLALSAIGFGWCWDIGACAKNYNDATREYSEYCRLNGYKTKVFFTTGPVESYGESGYKQSLKYDSIRNFVAADKKRILFDYADILCYDDDGTLDTTAWNGHTYPVITPANLGDASVGHIGPAGSLRLGKAMWWMLARIAGWDGKVKQTGK